MFVIIVKKESIYVLAKRLISDEQQALLRDNLSKQLSDNYFVQQ